MRGLLVKKRHAQVVGDNIWWGYKDGLYLISDESTAGDETGWWRDVHEEIWKHEPVLRDAVVRELSVSYVEDVEREALSYCTEGARRAIEGGRFLEASHFLVSAAYLNGEMRGEAG